MSLGLWHEVVLKKDLKLNSVVEWFREVTKSFKSMSNCWNTLTSYVHLITDWLTWKPNNGWDIQIGLDPMRGSQSYYKLSKELLQTLHSKGLCFLAQVTSMDLGVFIGDSWKSAKILDLLGEKKK